jgi:molybdopterin molybdotransferase
MLSVNLAEPMLTLDDARAKILADVPRVEDEDLPLDECLGRVLCEDVTARSPLPPFDYSAMDGYAVCTTDQKTTLPVIGESRAGGPLLDRLADNAAARIFTGAPIPARADAVIPQEDVQRDGDIMTVRALPPPGKHIRRRGEDLAEGARALEKGARLTAAQLGLIATVDRASVRVARKPRVVIVSTGDELRAPGSPNRPGSIVDGNSFMLRALCTRVGASAKSVHVIDDLAATRAAIREAMNADLILTVGGVSVGDHDHVRDALKAEGIELGFWKIAIKPGKPLAFGGRDRTRVLGLPGNPAAAFVTFHLFAAPLLRAMQGDASPMPIARARLRRDAKGTENRTELARARMHGDEVELFDNQASGAVTAIAWCDALAVLPMQTPSFPAGTPVDVYWPL